MENDIGSPYYDNNTTGGCGCGGTEGGYKGGNVFADSLMAMHYNDADSASYGSKAYIIYSSVISALFILSLLLLLLAYFLGSSGMQTAFSWITGLLLLGVLVQDIWHKGSKFTLSRSMPPPAQQ